MLNASNSLAVELACKVLFDPKTQGRNVKMPDKNNMPSTRKKNALPRLNNKDDNEHEFELDEEDRMEAEQQQQRIKACNTTTTAIVATTTETNIPIAIPVDTSDWVVVDENGDVHDGDDDAEDETWVIEDHANPITSFKSVLMTLGASIMDFSKDATVPVTTTVITSTTKGDGHEVDHDDVCNPLAASFYESKELDGRKGGNKRKRRNRGKR